MAAMNDWYTDLLAEEKRRDAERSFARQYRLAKEAAGEPLAGRWWAGLKRLYGSWLVSLGNWMVALGCRLQSRYELSVAQALPENESAPCS
jgi:hypothetical protein